MSNKIMLVEMDKIVHKDKTVAELMSNYFINITKTRNLKSSKNSNRSCDHVNIKKIKESVLQIIHSIKLVQYHWECRKKK